MFLYLLLFGGTAAAAAEDNLGTTLTLAHHTIPPTYTQPTGL